MARPWQRRILSALILFHLIVVPAGSLIGVHVANRRGVEKFLADYVYATRLRQYWALFSPEPRRSALRYYAVLTFVDGTTKVWQRPYAPTWGFFERHLAYHFQKWDLVSNYLDQHTGLWESLIGYLQNRYENLARIQFVRSSAPWPAPRSEGYVGGDANDLVWKDQTLFTYAVATRSFE